jgi:flagellar hook-associated protein 3 FlgL
MRITNLTTRQRRIGDIMRQQERLEEARDRVSTGLRIQKPSDSPTEIAELLRARTQVAELTRRRASTDVYLPFMRASEAALGDISSALRDVRNLVLQANNGTASPEQRQVLAEQVGRLRDRMRELANTQLNDRYLFAGTNTDTEPFTIGPPAAYTGNSSSLELSLTVGAPFATSITGDRLLNQRGSTDLFQNLSALENAVRTGDTSGMSAGLAALDEDLNNAVSLRADMGARIQYVELVRQRIEDHLVSVKGWQSSLQDVDLAEAIVEAKGEEVAHQATLMTAAQLDQPSLLDYLR